MADAVPNPLTNVPTIIRLFSSGTEISHEGSLRFAQVESLMAAGFAYRGRKKSLSPERIEDLRRRVAAGEKKLHLAKDFGISRETLYQYLRTDD